MIGDIEVAGRGVVVRLTEDVEASYVPIEEIHASLVKEMADPGILFGMLYGCARYDRKLRDVYLLEQEQWCTITLVRYNRREVVSSVSWTPVHCSLRGDLRGPSRMRARRGQRFKGPIH